ncbi:hypothetical protein Bhyg_02528, partial [Pseudolycoriella hygida]
MRAKFNAKNIQLSPGPAAYPCVKKEVQNKVMSIYPTDTKLPPTFKERHYIKNKQQVPAPNRYPQLEERSDDNKSIKDLMNKMISGKRAPMYSLGIKHSPKQHILILKNDEY